MTDVNGQTGDCFISKDIEHLARPIGEVRPDPKNARVHDEANIKAIMESLRVFGQQTPIKALPDGRVLKGNGTLEAARRLGWARIAVSTFDAGEEKAVGYAIHDNKTGDLSTWDYSTLSEQLQTLGDDYDLHAFGWGDSELGAIFNMQDDIDDKSKRDADGAKELGQDDLGGQDHKCPRCGFWF